MLIELNPDELEMITPIAPTRSQYVQYWDSAILNTGRVVFAIGGGVLVLLLSRLFNETGLGFILFTAGIFALLYPFLLGPLWEISRRNLAFRDVPYGYFFMGQVRGVYSRSVVVEERERLDEYGDLYIEEIREQQLEIEILDEKGFSFVVQTRDNPRYESIVPRQKIITLVKTPARDPKRNPVITEVYVIRQGIWVGDVSYLKRDMFLDLADALLAPESEPEPVYATDEDINEEGLEDF